jgi:uncharacterized protein (DUF169 family)
MLGRDFQERRTIMGEWAEKSKRLKEKLSLPSEPIGYRRLAEAKELEQIPGLTRWTRPCVFCQVPFMARVGGLTVGLTAEDPVGDRCKRIHGLLAADENSKLQEAKMLSRTWMPSVEEGLKQQEDYPRIPPGGAIVVGPLSKDNFDPEVVLIYGNPAQIMMLLCGLQKIRYERFPFHFIGEGACVDSLGQCYNTGKPAVALPCYGERSMGQVKDDEIVIALPPKDMDRAIEGLEILGKIGFKYPISSIGAYLDPNPLLAQFYPRKKE